MFAVGERAFLTHDHPRLDATRAADDAGHAPVISLGAELKLAGAPRINRDDHAGFDLRRHPLVVRLFEIDLEVLGKISAARDLENAHAGSSYDIECDASGCVTELAAEAAGAGAVPPNADAAACAVNRYPTC